MSLAYYGIIFSVFYLTVLAVGVFILPSFSVGLCYSFGSWCVYVTIVFCGFVLQF